MSRGSRFRLTGGLQKGRTLYGPPSPKTRPMQGFLRQALFNIIGERISDASVLDLFSGTGSIGIEAWSRGASSCIFVENDKAAVRVLRKNMEAAGLQERSKIICCNILRIKSFPSTPFEPYDVIFLDPPFSFHDRGSRRDLNPLVMILEDQGLLNDDRLLILQVRKDQTPPATLGTLSICDKRNHGSVSLTFYK